MLLWIRCACEKYGLELEFRLMVNLFLLNRPDKLRADRFGISGVK